MEGEEGVSGAPDPIGGESLKIEAKNFSLTVLWPRDTFQPNF